MVFFDYNSKVVLEKNMRFNIFITGRWSERQHKVDRTIAQHLHQFCHRLIKYIQLDARVFLGKLDERLCQNRAEGIGHAYVKSSSGNGGKVVDLCHTAFSLGKSAPGKRENLLRRFCQKNNI